MDAMTGHRMMRLREHGELLSQAADWFHQKWSIPRSAYIESMEECLAGNGFVPQWYVVMREREIIAGIGLIENDFHSRKDLAPNVCAVFVEAAYRNRGIAGEMLRFVCEDCRARGIDTLYLVTDHTSFYERYGWTFLCMVDCDGAASPSRLYVHRA